MNPTKIDILGEDYFVLSLTGSEEDCDGAILKGKRTVHILPSLIADFCVRFYSKDGAQLSYDPASTVAAAAHLSLKRGLPLDEFVFETPSGFLKISCTGNGFFTVTIPKCKVLFTEQIESLGCAVRYTDVFVGAVCRVVRAENIKTADLSALTPLISAGRYLPSAVLFFSLDGKDLSILPYTDFNPSPPTVLELYAAAAQASRNQEREFEALGGRLFVRAGYSDVSLKIKCELTE